MNQSAAIARRRDFVVLLGMNSGSSPTRHLARFTFVAFLLTFILARTLVILIMARKLPDLFLHVGGTHVHHLNYGIFLLATVAAYCCSGR
jgi:hypothetical protein